MSETRVIFCTCPAEHAERIARALLEDRLVACVNVLPQVRSLYWWQNAIQDDAEVLLIMKSPTACFAQLECRIRELHPYTVPEIIALDVAEGSEPYLRWVRDMTRP